MNRPLVEFVAIAAAMSAMGLWWTVRPLLVGPPAAGKLSTTLAVMLSVSCLTALLYASLGHVEALRIPPPDTVTARVDQMVARLAAHLADQPADARGWRLLARSYDEMGRFADASRAWTRLVELEPGNADALADLANTLSTEQSGRYAGEPIRRAREALAIDPGNAKALAIAANEASERKDFDAAVAAWERLRAVVPPGSPVMQAIDENIAAAREAAGR